MQRIYRGYPQRVSMEETAPENWMTAGGGQEVWPQADYMQGGYGQSAYGQSTYGQSGYPQNNYVQNNYPPNGKRVYAPNVYAQYGGLPPVDMMYPMDMMFMEMSPMDQEADMMDPMAPMDPVAVNLSDMDPGAVNSSASADPSLLMDPPAEPQDQNPAGAAAPSQPSETAQVRARQEISGQTEPVVQTEAAMAFESGSAPKPYMLYNREQQVRENTAENRRRMNALQQDYFKGLYPQSVRSRQQLVEEACDGLEHEGSFLYDEYPDRTDVYRTRDVICQNAVSRGLSEDRDLTQVLLVDEMGRRRMQKG